MDFYAGIDGTGPGSDALYAKEFANTYVSQLYRSSRFNTRYYTRGPTWEGGTAKAISQAMHREMEKRVHQQGGLPVSRIILAGYSRGGAIAIRVCRELAAHGHKVHCLLLYDAVDMSLAISAKLIPSNVRYCFHAMRNPLSRSRSSWGNCGTERQVKNDAVTYFRRRHFMCTHGAMGGLPWDHADPDGIINEALTKHESAVALEKARRNPAIRLSRLTPFGGAAAGLDAADALNDWHRRASRTTISLQQDRQESAAVGTWMSHQLDWALKQKAAEDVPVG